MKEFDVAIVGAGPAGSSTAITLVRHGFSVALIDRAIFPRDKLCGDFLNPINWPLLKELSVVEEILACPHEKITTFRITAANGADAISLLPAQVGQSFGVGLKRLYLDQTLLKRAERLGASVQQGVKVTGVEADSHGWRLEFAKAAPCASVRAKLLVAADGRNSFIAQRLRMATPHRNHAASVGFQVHLKNVHVLPNSVEIHQFAGGYAGLSRVDEETVNLCLTLSPAQLSKSPSFDKLRQHWLYGNRHLRGLLVGAEPVSALRSVWPVYFPRRRCGGERFLLVGDAAGVTEPVTGEGIYFALRSGQLAAITLARALRDGRWNDRLLRQYERACRNDFSARLRLNRWIQFLMYRPSALGAVLRLFTEQRWMLDSLVRRVCLARMVPYSSSMIGH
jgi:menaquinone-9 beta-reductase